MIALPRAILLAAGQGLRMRPLTLTLPKPMLRLGGRPLLEWAYFSLRDAGVQEIMINVSYLKDSILRYFDNHLGVHFSEEPETPWETAGAIVNVLPFFENQPFFAMNADGLWKDEGSENVFKTLMHHWDPRAMDVLLVLAPKEKSFGFSGLGDYFMESDGRLVRKRDQAVKAPYVYTGIQLASPHIYENEPLRPFSNRDIYDKAEARERLYGILPSGTFFHIGTPEAYAKAGPLFLTK